MPASEIDAQATAEYVPPPAPPSLEPPPEPRRVLRGWRVAIAGLLVAVVAVGGVLALRLNGASAGVQDRPTANLVAALNARGLDCSQVPNLGAAKVWGCLRDTSPSYEYAVTQYGADGHLAHLEAKVDRLGLNTGSYDSRGQAAALFRTILQSALEPGQGDSLLTWVQGAVKSGGGNTTQGDLTADLSTYRSDLVKLVIGVRGTERVKLSQALPRVTTDQGQGFLENKGFACRPETGFLYCELDKASIYGDAAFFHDQGSAVGGINLLVHAQGDASSDVTARIDEWFPACIGLVLQGDDAAKAARWVSDHLGKAWHVAVIGGVKLQMYGFRPESWGPSGIWGMRMEVATLDWP